MTYFSTTVVPQGWCFSPWKPILIMAHEFVTTKPSEEVARARHAGQSRPFKLPSSEAYIQSSTSNLLWFDTILFFIGCPTRCLPWSSENLSPNQAALLAHLNLGNLSSFVAKFRPDAHPTSISNIDELNNLFIFHKLTNISISVLGFQKNLMISCGGFKWIDKPNSLESMATDHHLLPGILSELLLL